MKIPNIKRQITRFDRDYHDRVAEITTYLDLKLYEIDMLTLRQDDIMNLIHESEDDDYRESKLKLYSRYQHSIDKAHKSIDKIDSFCYSHQVKINVTESN